MRPFAEEDEAAVEALLRAAWPADPELRQISAIHGPDLDGEDRWRRTLVCVSSGEVVGAGTLVGSARHPARYFLVLVVAHGFRRRGIASELLARLVALGDGRPLLARVRETDEAGLGRWQRHRRRGCASGAGCCRTGPRALARSPNVDRSRRSKPRAISDPGRVARGNGSGASPTQQRRSTSAAGTRNTGRRERGAACRVLKIA